MQDIRYYQYGAQEQEAEKALLQLTPEDSGAVVSIAVAKEGFLSPLIGHNLILRVARFVLRAAPSVPTIESLLKDADPAWGWTRDDARLAQCCFAVAGATMKVKTITVHGAAPNIFTRPKVSASTDGHYQRGDEEEEGGGGGKKGDRHIFPALFRWPTQMMSEGDVGQIEQNIWGTKGKLGTRERFQPGFKPGSTIHDIGGFYDIDFKRDWSSPEWRVEMETLRAKPPFQIAGGLRIHGRRLPVYCNAFLTSSKFAGPHMAAMAARSGGSKEEQQQLAKAEAEGKSRSDIVVFQCPVKSSRWNLDAVNQFGVLKTMDEVLVEVAVPTESLLRNYSA